MQAIIFADRHGEELTPLCNECCPAMLTIANHPVLEHTLNDLAMAGITEALIVISNDSLDIKSYFGDGVMWGMKFTYLLSRGEESPDRLIERYNSLLKPPFIALRGDVFRSPICKTFLNNVSSGQLQTARTQLTEPKADLLFTHENNISLQCLDWKLKTNHKTVANIPHLGEVSCSALNSLADFHQTSLSVVKNHMGSAVVHEIDKNLTTGHHTNTYPENNVSGQILIGKQTNIHKQARLTGPVIIGDRCYIDRHANITNSIILSGTYVGEGIEIKNAIVSGNLLIRVDTNSCIQLNDPVLLDNIKASNSLMATTWRERITAALLLLLSVPLWPLALITSIRRETKALFIEKNLPGNRNINNAAEMRQHYKAGKLLDSPIPIFRHIPLLWSVVKGDLRLFGSTNILIDHNAIDSTHQIMHKNDMAAGLLGPIQLYLSADVPAEEVYLNEITFQQNTGFLYFFKHLFQASILLFKARTWRPIQNNSGEIEHVY